MFTSDGEFLGMWGSFGAGPGQFDFPWSVAVSTSGRIYVTDMTVFVQQRYAFIRAQYVQR